MRRRIARYFVNGKEFYVQSGPVYSPDADITFRYMGSPGHHTVNTPNKAAEREHEDRYNDLRQWKEGHDYFVVWGRRIYRFEGLEELDTWMQEFLYQKKLYRIVR